MAQVLEEVLVVAQKRAQNPQDLALSVSAIDGDVITEGNIVSVLDLQNLAPSLSIGDNLGFAQIFIRGIGLDNVFTGSDPSIQLHVDGVAIGRAAAQLGSFYDLERIEILRGPQGTLYGRNATGGSINLITRKPEDQRSGYLRLGAGNYETLNLEAAAGGRLGRDVAGRLATRIYERDGYGENKATGDDIDDASRSNVRGHLLWTPTDRTEVLLSADYAEEDDAAYGFKFVGAAFPDDPDFPATGLLPGNEVARDERDLASDVDITNDRDNWGLSATLGHDIADSYWTLKSITAYRDFETTPRIDLDMSTAVFIGVSQALQSEQFSQEFQAVYDGNKLGGVMGLYYYDEEIDGDNRFGGSAPDRTPTEALFGNFAGTTDIEVWAAYASFDYYLRPDLQLNLGGRFTYEERSSRNTSSFSGPQEFPLLDQDGDFNDFSPRVGLTWYFADDAMAYANYSQGFKSGVFLTGQPDELNDPEEVDAWEAGVKSRLWRERIQLNAALFYYDYTDLQVGRTVVTPQGFAVVNENAASAEITGAELEFSWLPTRDLLLEANLGWLDAEYEEFLTQDPMSANLGTEQTQVDAGGNNMVQAPELTANLRGRYEFDVADFGRGAVSVRVVYRDDVYFTPVNNDRLSQDSVTTLDASFTLDSNDGAWQLNVWGRNLTDEFIYSSMVAVSSSRSIAATQQPPREYGVSVTYQF